MKLLLHICCAPCAIMPLAELRKGFAETQIIGYFFNPNIQPFKEHERRLTTLRQWARDQALPLEEKPYNPLGWLRQVVYNESRRCSICYQMRMLEAGRMARQLGCQAFTSTLLYSIYQDRPAILAAANSAALTCGVDFLEMDFRPLWREGQGKARELELYRQPYCGCIYSEAERYMKTDLTLSLPRGENNGV